MNLVSTEWLNNNLSKVKIFDASWHMPSTKRSGRNEYSNKHIPGALFWDLDEHSDKDSPFPHNFLFTSFKIFPAYHLQQEFYK